MRIHILFARTSLKRSHDLHIGMKFLELKLSYPLIEHNDCNILHHYICIFLAINLNKPEKQMTQKITRKFLEIIKIQFIFPSISMIVQMLRVVPYAHIVSTEMRALVPKMATPPEFKSNKPILVSRFVYLKYPTPQRKISLSKIRNN